MLEDLENRLVLSGRPPLILPDSAGARPGRRRLQYSPHRRCRAGPARERGHRLAPGIAGGPGLQLPAGSGSSGGSSAPSPASPQAVSGAILGNLPVGSPFGSTGPQQITGLAGPAGYIPLQIQTAYGLSTGSAYNNDISFGTIKGDGTGQTIGIYEEGYNPAFVDTSASNYSTSALAVFDKTFGLPDPPSLTFVDHTGTPLSATNNSSNNPDFLDYGAGPEIALDIESAHADGARGQDRRPLRRPGPR